MLPAVVQLVEVVVASGQVQQVLLAEVLWTVWLGTGLLDLARLVEPIQKAWVVVVWFG